MIPVTHFYALHGLSDRVRQGIFADFADAGGKHIVLTDHCVAQIMTDARNELRRLGKYREDLKRQLNEYRAEGNHSDQDIEDFAAAANKMLEANGCRPIKMPTLLLRYIREKQAQSQQQQN